MTWTLFGEKMPPMYTKVLVGFKRGYFNDYKIGEFKNEWFLTHAILRGNDGNEFSVSKLDYWTLLPPFEEAKGE